MRKSKHKAITDEAKKHGEKVKRAAKNSKLPIILHFDGKIIQDITDVIKMKRDQFAVIANIDETFYLLAIPAIESGTGEDQFKALVECCEEYDLKDKVKGICFDTMVSNTSTKSGTNVRFSKYEGSIMI